MKKLLFLLFLSLWPLASLAGMNVLSGNVSHRQALIAAPGGPLPLTSDLSYNSLDRIGGVLGVGWSHSYDIYLHQNSDGTMVLTGGVGKRFYFVDGTGYRARTGDFSTLVHNGDDTWTVTLRSGLQYRFGSDKKLAAIVDRYGNTVTVVHDKVDEIIVSTTVTDPAGRSAVIHYSAGKIDWIKNPAQKQYDFTYHATTGLLETVTYPEPVTGAGRPRWEYHYTATGSYLEYVKDPEGHITKYGYTNGKVTRQVDPKGVLDMNGGESADVALHTKTLQYGVPAANQTTLTEKDGGLWIYTYDATEGVLTAKAAPDGTVTSYSYYAANDDYPYLQKEVVTPIDATTVRVVRTEDYDSSGNPTVVKTLSRPAGGGAETLHGHLVYSYGSFDRVTGVTDLVAGTTVTVNYTTNNGEETVTVIAPMINAGDASGPQTVLVYRTDGQLRQVTDPLGRVTTYAYGANGLPESVLDTITGIAAGFGNFDFLGRPGTVTVSKSGQPDRVTTIGYNTLGRPTDVSRPNVVLKAGDDPVTLLTQFGYDLVGNRTSVTDAENKTTRFDYNARGDVTHITDPLKQITELLYSGAGCGSCGGGVDKLVGVKDAKLHQTDFRYYPTGELKSETDPLGKRMLYTYYPSGQLKEKRRDADNDEAVSTGDQMVLSFTYAPDGKLASKTDHVANETTTFSYYPVGHVHADLLQSVDSPAITYTFDYFDNGWLKSVTDSNGRVVRYDAYDVLGRRELVTLLPGTAEARVLDYVYDGQKRLEKIVTEIDAQHAGNEEFVFGYDAWQRRATLTYPNGVVANYSYNNQTDWLTGIDYQNLVLTIGYPENDKVGNRKERVEDGAATTYGYDVTYQLAQAKTGASEENFTYDAVGNRESGPTVKDTPADAYVHDVANRMERGRKFGYDYDDFGNQVKRSMGAGKEWVYTWNGENRLTRAELKKDGQVLRTVTFKYDPFGRRIEKRVAGLAPQEPAPRTTTYLYDGEDIVLEYVNDGTTTTSTHYVHGPGIDEPLALVRGGQSYFYHVDGLGSIVAISDSARNIVQRYAYESFGMLTASNPAFENPYTYAGREYDKEMGVYYYRARYYDPMEGRFISKDPIGFAGGDVNVYRYVQGNSANYIDPWGLHEWKRPHNHSDNLHPRRPDAYAETKERITTFYRPFKDQHEYIQEAINIHEAYHQDHQWGMAFQSEINFEKDTYEYEIQYIDERVACLPDSDPGKNKLIEFKKKILKGFYNEYGVHLEPK